ncbi:hypothetical protein GDO78_007664 [Eleutherodactylus coqui]|uniref:Uncharacterized protein n=1 Tax=Eleutherodactylus coqui TaxID=57060 RepID=A0A8J6KBM9_ELECQ|nr:hypothetical protein GDO78_007664 [Eleutherodactylus coqui]
MAWYCSSECIYPRLKVSRKSVLTSRPKKREKASNPTIARWLRDTISSCYKSEGRSPPRRHPYPLYHSYSNILGRMCSNFS